MIVDDEQPARDRLQRLLRWFDDLTIAGTAENGEEAIKLIRELQPDLVLLDIQMPGCSGIDVARSLPAPLPKIIFCTAYDQYAIEAFELNAVDYLMKPVNRIRLGTAIERTRGLSIAEAGTKVDRAVQGPHLAPIRFLGKRGSRIHVISHQEVVYFGSESGLTKLHTKDQGYVMEPTLNDFERRLDPNLYCRISRTAVVNLDYISEVHTLMGGYGEMILKTGMRLEISRRKLKILMRILEGSGTGIPVE
jgi:two-component system LytT family response regulator